MIDSRTLHSMFPSQKVDDAKSLLVTVNPWWKRYLDRFEVVPISVPVHSDDGQDKWRARVSIPDTSLTMYVDLDFAMSASLPQIAGEIEKALQFSRRRFSERSQKVPEVARGEYLSIGQHMEVGSALTRKYDASSLRNPEALSKLLNSSVTFGPSLVDKYDVDELPVTDTSWMPSMFDLDEGMSAEQYAVEMARRDGLFDTPESQDTEEEGGSGDGSSEGEQGESGGSEDSASEQETVEGTEDQDAEQSADESGEQGGGEPSSDEGEESGGEEDNDSELGSPQSGSEGTGGDENAPDDDANGDEDGGDNSTESQDATGQEDSEEDRDADSDQDSESGDSDDAADQQSGEDGSESGEGQQRESGSGAGDGSDADGGGEGVAEGGSHTPPQQDSPSDSTDPDSYETMHTDNGEGQGRLGGWQGHDAQTGEHDASDNDALTNEDGSAQSTGIEESNQVASSDAATDRASSGTGGDISQAQSQSSIAEQIQQMRQEFPSLDWDAEDSRPEAYDPDYTEDVDEFEEAERSLEATEREQADAELAEDVHLAAQATGFDPAAPIPPMDDDVEVATEELHRTGHHWTDVLTDMVTGAVSSVVLRGSDDFSYAVRNPNQALTGPILMGSITYAPTVYAVFDTSGSMLSALRRVRDYLYELFEDIRDTYNAEVRWFAASSDVYATGEAAEFDAEVFSAFARGGGNTDFGGSLAQIIDGSFEFVDEGFEQPDVVVCFSDMQVRWPEALQVEPEAEFISVMPLECTVPKARKAATRVYGNPEWLYDDARLVAMY